MAKKNWTPFKQKDEAPIKEQWWHRRLMNSRDVRVFDSSAYKRFISAAAVRKRYLSLIKGVEREKAEGPDYWKPTKYDLTRWGKLGPDWKIV